MRGVGAWPNSIV